MPETLVCSMNGTFDTDVTTSQIQALLAQPENTIWLDVRDPNEHDIALLRDEFHFHPLALEDISHGRERAKAEVYEHYYFVIFYSICPPTDERRFDIQPLYLFIGANYLVSVHNGEFQQVNETIRRWRDPNAPPGDRSGALLYALLDTIVDDYFPLLDQLADDVDTIEDMIFEQFENSSIQQIFSMKRDLLLLRRVIAPERDALNVLMRRELPLFRGKDVTYLQDVYDHIIRITDTVDSYRDLLSSAVDSYLSVEASRQNKILKVLTVTSIILMGDALIAGIYGMNFEFMPELHWHFGYAYALGLMVVLSLTLLAVFKRLKWI